MPYTARFSKAFLKKEKRLPSEVNYLVLKDEACLVRDKVRVD
jgi:hypothetical protein